MKRGWVFLLALLLINVSFASAAVLFESEWNNSLGNSSTSRTDGGKWDTAGGNGLSVISSSGLDFPTTNVLEVTALEATTGFAFLRKTGMAVPSIGESRYYRWYSRVVATDGLSDTETHPHQDGNAIGDSNWLFHVFHNSGGNGFYRPRFMSRAVENPSHTFYLLDGTLNKGVTYRFELNITRTGTSTFQMHANVYNSSGDLIYNDSNFVNEDNASESLANNITFNFHDLNNMDGFNAGLNGLGGSEWFPSMVYMYQGAICIRNDTWCGAYGAAASTNAADLNTDDKVDFSDILIIIRRILGLNSNTAADLNNDGAVNIFDLVNASRLFGKQYGTDTTAPQIVSSRPVNNTNLSAGTTSVVLFAETNERATCRYLNTTSGSFATMNNFTRSGRVSHSIQLTGLQDGTTYNYYIQCRDETGNLNSTNYVVSFGVNSNAGVLFSSDWSTITGLNSPTAVRDGIKWDGECCDANVNNGVVTAASLGITDWP